MREGHNDLSDRLHFKPNILVISDIDEYFEQLLVKFVTSIKDNEDWNVAALLHDSYIKILKLGKEIKLNTEMGYWTPDRLKLVKFNFTFEELAPL